ncbi:MAG: MFS transporter [Gammaproteobacteria bacterium]|nr:MFS transporter [Gammaproteobacteria bacterium]
MYDWANSAFATTIMAGFFPIFFKDFWSTGLPATQSTFWLGFGNSATALLVAIAAPLLGAVADRGGLSKRFLLIAASLGIAATAAMFWVNQGRWELALLLYVLAGTGFAAANVFYDGLLIPVSGKHDLDLVSGYGFSLGYLGGGALFAINVAMVQRPDWFGLEDAAQAVRFAFLSVAIWWAIFTLPLALNVDEPRPAGRQSVAAAVREGVAQLAHTFRELRELKTVALFLAAYWLYIDGVYTIIKMAVDYGATLGLARGDLILALLITQFVGFPSALFFGWIGGRIGAKTGILVALGVYCAATVNAYFMDTSAEFFRLAIAIGLVQGGVQSLSRSLFARLIPADKSMEYFGFYNMVGRFSAIIGPVLVGGVALIFDDSRLAMMSVLILLVSGAVLLTTVNVALGEKRALALQGRQLS